MRAIFSASWAARSRCRPTGTTFVGPPDTQRLVGVELLRREQVSRTGRAELCGESPRRAPERHDAPGHLELGKYGIGGRDGDLRGEDQLDSEGVATSVNGDHHGLRARLAQEVPWVDQARW